MYFASEPEIPDIFAFLQKTSKEEKSKKNQKGGGKGEKKKMSSRECYPSSSQNPIASSGGREVFSLTKSLLSVLPGEVFESFIQAEVYGFNTYHVHYFTNASVTIDLSWSPSIEKNFVWERSIPVLASVGGIGEIISASTKSRFLSITIMNTDIVPLTDVRISIYAVA